MRCCSSTPPPPLLLLLLLLLAGAAGAPCPPRTTPLSAPGKALLAPVVFHGRLSGLLARRGAAAAQQATFKVDRVFKGLPHDTAFAVVEFALGRCAHGNAFRGGSPAPDARNKTGCGDPCRGDEQPPPDTGNSTRCIGNACRGGSPAPDAHHSGNKTGCRGGARRNLCRLSEDRKCRRGGRRNSCRGGGGGAPGRCRGVPIAETDLKLGERYVVFARATRKKRQRMVAVAAPEPYAKRRAVARVLCENCAKAPTVRGLEDDVRVDMHAKLKLKCRVSGNPPPRVVWYKNGLRLKADGRIKLRSKRRYSHLVINRVSLEDAGHYKCIAKNILGNATAFANVITTTATTESPFWHLRKDPCPEKNFCLNGGVCIYFRVVKEYACECADGYGGQRCETKVISTLSIDFQD